MKSLVVSTLSAALAFVVFAPPAAACDPHCAKLERVGGTLVVGLPTTLLTSLIAPAVAARLSIPAPDERLPSYGAGFTYTLLGASVGMTAAYLLHARMYPDSENGNGSDLDHNSLIAMFTLPPLVLGAGTAVYVYRNHRQKKRPEAGAPGWSTALVAPTRDGAMASVGGYF